MTDPNHLNVKMQTVYSGTFGAHVMRLLFWLFWQEDSSVRSKN